MSGDLKNLCLGLPTRPPEKKGGLDYYMPQAITRILFTKYFQKKCEAGAVVLSELEYVSTLFTGKPLVNKLLEALTSDFANAWTQSTLKGKVQNLKPGRPRKPDVLGIGQEKGGGWVIELVEVTTEKQAESTIKEDIQPKLQVLNDKVMPIFQQTVADEQGFTAMPVRVQASTWRPADGELTWPYLPFNASPKKFEWICLRPTFRASPPKGQDGLILYEIHSMGLPESLPQEMIDRVKKLLKQNTGATRLSLLPELNDHWRQNPADADAMKALAIAAGIGLVAVVAIIFLPELAAAAGTVEAGLAAAALAQRVAAAGAAIAAAAPKAFEVAKAFVDSLKISVPAFN